MDGAERPYFWGKVYHHGCFHYGGQLLRNCGKSNLPATRPTSVSNRMDCNGLAPVAGAGHGHLGECAIQGFEQTSAATRATHRGHKVPLLDGLCDAFVVIDKSTSTERWWIWVDEWESPQSGDDEFPWLDLTSMQVMAIPRSVVVQLELQRSHSYRNERNRTLMRSKNRL